MEEHERAPSLREMDDSRRVWPRLINTGPLFPVEMFRALPLIDFPRICRLCVAPAGERKPIWGFIGRRRRLLSYAVP